MTVQELANELQLQVFALPDPTRSISGCYCGDLLSWVMGRAQADEIWLTIMSNQNVAAVASLSDLACVLLAEGVAPDAALLEKATSQHINLLGTPLPIFGACQRLAPLL